MIHLLICDDHEMVRTGLSRALQADGRFQVLAMAATAEEVQVLVHPGMRADVLLLDLNLGNKGLAAGIELISRLSAAHAALPILIVSMHNDPNVVQSAMDAGARGYVTKESAVSVLEEGIVHLHAGRRFIDPNLIEPLIRQGRRGAHEQWDAALTKREREVMHMLFEGQRVSDIALDMGLSIKTVSTHKVRLMEKLNIANNSDLVKLGMRHRAPA